MHYAPQMFIQAHLPLEGKVWNINVDFPVENRNVYLYDMIGYFSFNTTGVCSAFLIQLAFHFCLYKGEKSGFDFWAATLRQKSIFNISVGGWSGGSVVKSAFSCWRQLKLVTSTFVGWLATACNSHLQRAGCSLLDSAGTYTYVHIPHWTAGHISKPWGDF